DNREQGGGTSFSARIDYLEISDAPGGNNNDAASKFAKYAGEYVGIVAPTTFTGDCDARAMASLTVSIAGSVTLDVYSYDFDIVSQGVGTIAPNGKLNILLDGLPVTGTVSRGGTAR